MLNVEQSHRIASSKRSTLSRHWWTARHQLYPLVDFVNPVCEQTWLPDFGDRIKGTSDLEYEEFCSEMNEERIVWQIKKWPTVVWVTLGLKETLIYCGVLSVVLTPCVLLAAHALITQRYGLLVWVAFALWGYWSSSTAPKSIGILTFLILAFIGLSSSMILQDRVLFAAGIIPGITWFFSCIVLGSTASYLIDALCASEETFDELRARGLLFKYGALTPEDEAQ